MYTPSNSYHSNVAITTPNSRQSTATVQTNDTKNPTTPTLSIRLYPIDETSRKEHIHSKNAGSSRDQLSLVSTWEGHIVAVMNWRLTVLSLVMSVSIKLMK